MTRRRAKRPKAARKSSGPGVGAKPRKRAPKKGERPRSGEGVTCRLSRSRARFLKSSSRLVEVLRDIGLVSLKTARALHRSLEASVARRPEGFSLTSSANLCNKVANLVANSSPSGRDKRHREMDGLEAISRSISSMAGDERVLEKSLSLLRELVPFQNGALFVLREDTGKLELQATLGYPQDLIERVQFDMGQGLSAWAAREKKSILVRKLSRPEKDGLERLGSFLAVPIIAGSRSVGVITMGHPQPGAFTSDHKRILQLFCTLISGTVLSSRAETSRAEKKEEVIAAV